MGKKEKNTSKSVYSGITVENEKYHQNQKSGGNAHLEAVKRPGM